MKKLRYIGIFFLAQILFISCGKTDDEIPSPITNFNGTFTGIMETQGIDNNLEGFIIINDQDILIDVMTGTLKGSITDEGSFYNVTINESKGIFAGSAGLSGSLGIEQSEFDFVINGDYVKGSIIRIHGQGAQMEDRDQLWRDARSKSTVYFTHSESCDATITLNNTTLGELNGSSVESEDGQETRCDATYKDWDAIHRNVDDFQSRLFCNTGMMKNLSGDYFTYTACNTAGFVLPKNQTFTYTVHWDNGHVTTGELTSPDGGLSLPICLTNDTCSDLGSGNTGGETGTRNNQFTVDGKTYHVDNYILRNEFCSDSNININMAIPPNGQDYFTIVKMPSASNGTFSFADGTSGDCVIFGELMAGGVFGRTGSGTLTKTGAKSYTFSCVIENNTTGKMHNVTGSGTY